MNKCNNPGGYFLGGNFPGGSYPGWNFSVWELSRCELSWVEIVRVGVILSGGFVWQEFYKWELSGGIIWVALFGMEVFLVSTDERRLAFAYRISDTSRAGFEPAQNMSAPIVECGGICCSSVFRKKLLKFALFCQPLSSQIWFGVGGI